MTEKTRLEEDLEQLSTERGVKRGGLQWIWFLLFLISLLLLFILYNRYTELETQLRQSSIRQQVLEIEIQQLRYQLKRYSTEEGIKEVKD